MLHSGVENISRNKLWWLRRDEMRAIKEFFQSARWDSCPGRAKGKLSVYEWCSSMRTDKTNKVRRVCLALKDWVSRVLDLVHAPTAAVLSACAFFTNPISMRDCFFLSFTPSEIISSVLSASIQQSRPPQALCYGSEVDSCVGHLLLPAVCCYDRLLPLAVQPPQGGAWWVDSLKLDQ